MKHEGMDVCKETPTGDVIASPEEAIEAIEQGRLAKVGPDEYAYWVILTDQSGIDGKALR